MAETLSSIAKKLSFTASKKAGSKKRAAKIYFNAANEKWPASVLKGIGSFDASQIKGGAPIVKTSDKNGPVVFVQSRQVEKPDHYGFFGPTPYSLARDLMAGAARGLVDEGLDSIVVDYLGKNDEEMLGLVVGLEMICYDFAKLWPVHSIKVPSISISGKSKKQSSILQSGRALGAAVNLARFLVDLPPNALQPKSYGELAKGLFPSKGKIKTEVWSEARLKKEKMGLHLAVGQAAEHGPCMIHISYRHPQCKDKPLAFVGKGITFDTGGLDIKPASGMRLMKKDMGGSASVMGVAYWVQQTQPKVNCDFYLAVAENAVAGNSFHPGDIITAKNGMTVEIHNTDAEGRLVLADVLTVAAHKKPRLLIDVATLTGAIKYGLGSSTPGLFSNNDNLAELLLRSAQARGENAWRMPLVPEERGRLRSDVADMVNCTDGFGGAVTAALFLEKFTGKIPWAHFDIYGWNDRGKGAYKKSGGNGQLVQAISEFIDSQSQ